MAALIPYNVSISDGTNTVVIATTQPVEIDWVNAITPVSQPTMIQERESAVAERKMKYVNLLMLAKNFYVTGELCEGVQEYASGQNETKSVAKDKRDLIEEMIQRGRPMTLLFDGVTHNGVFTKCKIGHPARDINAAPADGTAVLTIQFTFLVGSDMQVQT